MAQQQLAVAAAERLEVDLGVRERHAAGLDFAIRSAGTNTWRPATWATAPLTGG